MLYLLIVAIVKNSNYFTQDFTGNTDWGTVVYHELQPPIRARYIRFRPVTWNGHIAMRVELYGCIEGTIEDGQCRFRALIGNKVHFTRDLDYMGFR